MFIEAIMDPDFSKSEHMNNLFPDNRNVWTNYDNKVNISESEQKFDIYDKISEEQHKANDDNKIIDNNQE